MLKNRCCQDDWDTPTSSAEGQESDDETLGVVQDATAMDEGVDTGASAVNERGNTSENQADTFVVHSDLIGELKNF